MNPDTSIAPYYNDYDETKNYQQILWRPDRAVQARELNQAQTYLQKQISRFGDNIFKQGSVVSGCHVTAIESLPYIKIKDISTTGERAVVDRYKQLYIKNAAGTVGVVIAVASGFENAAPDLNTLFVRYINSGDDGISPTFNADETLTIYNPSYAVEDVAINNGGFGFSNTDTVSFISAAKVANSTGGSTFTAGLYPGDIVANGAGANVAIQTIATVGSDTVVTFRPTSSDLVASNTAAWNITQSTFTDANTGQTFVVSDVLGSGATGQIVTNNNGAITDVVVISSGSGYSVAPTAVPVSTAAPAAQKQQVVLIAENYTDQVVVAGPTVAPIGTGYGVTIDEGIIYQNQTFTRTDKQFVVVDKYATNPTNVVVGFTSHADIVTYLDDPTLVDNASGFNNFNAPGADRLRVTSAALVLPKDEASRRTDFVTLVEFSDGQPVKVNDGSTYNVINDAIAQRAYETNGNFVIDSFVATTKSGSIANEPTTVNVVVDPGTGYINGYRVNTERNYVLPISKGTTTKTVQTETNADYGCYVTCSAIAGPMDNLIGATVLLKETGSDTTWQSGFITTSTATLGQARIRGVKAVTENGVTKYNIYLFDIALNAGVPFSSVGGLSTDNTSNPNFSAIVESRTIALPNNSRAIFNIPADAVKTVANVSYTYQKEWGQVAANSSGNIVLTVTNPETFPVAGALSRDQLNQIIVTPTANIVSSASLGNVDTAENWSNVSAYSPVFASLNVGTYVSIGNSSSNSIHKIVAIQNTSIATVSPAPTVEYVGGAIRRAVIKNFPIALASANVSVDQLTLTANIGFAIPATNVNVTSPVETSPVVAAKAVTRNAAVRLSLGTNAAGTVGPWCLGHSDIIRLRGVYRGSNTTFTSASTGVVDITNDFYIDSNQTPDATGLGYLYQKTNPKNSITSSHHLLAVFDLVKSATASVRTVGSYTLDDDSALGSLPAAINTMELPEVNGPNQYYDVRDSFDFRPIAANTVAITTTQAIAPINPTEPAYADRYAGDVQYPAPDTTISSTVEYYQPRNDLVIAASNGDISVVSGQPGTLQFADQPAKSIVINKMVVPPYPSLAAALSSDMAKIVDTKIASDKYANRRKSRFTISTMLTSQQIAEQQPRRYTMEDIGQIDRRMTAVEYSLALSLAETQTGNRNIPSVNDPSTDRFKFGFFVDSFADSSRSDTTNPQYSATIVNNVVQPRTVEYVIAMTPDDSEDAGTGTTVTLPYNNEILLSQLGATDGAVIPPVIPEPVDPGVIIPTEPGVVNPPVTPPPTDDIIVPITQQQIQTYNFEQLGLGYNKNGRTFDDHFFVLSANEGPCKLFINFHDNQYAMEVFQATSRDLFPTSPAYTTSHLIKSTQSMVRMSSAEKTELWPAINVAGYRFEDVQMEGYTGDSPYRKFVVEDAGKLEWHHNPANGTHYMLRITKYKHSGSSASKGRYKCQFRYPADYTVNITVPDVPLSIDYNGTVSSIAPDKFTPGSFTDALSTTYYTPAQSFDITVNGLKPGTIHTFTFDGVAASAKCKPVGGNIGDSLKTDGSGSVSFTYYYNANTATPTTAVEFANLVANASAGAKSFSLWDNNKSFAYGIIMSKAYVNNASGGNNSVSGDGSGGDYWNGQNLLRNNEQLV